MRARSRSVDPSCPWFRLVSINFPTVVPESLRSTSHGTLLFDTAPPNAAQRESLVFQEPIAVLQAHSILEVHSTLEAVDQAVADGYWVAGYLAYEAGYAFEEVASEPSLPYPLLWFGVYDEPTRQAGFDFADVASPQSSFQVHDLAFRLPRREYLDAIAAIKQYIREGDVYQINFTDAFTFSFKGDPWAFYEALRHRQRVAYGAFLQLEACTILSLSPELFFQREGNRIVTRPMKGTVKRGRTWEEDEQLRHWLAADEKSQAENLMIVDLLRNDLSVCCEPGTVRVPALFNTEAYETLIQMTSTVEGNLKDGIRYADLFRALFPCGSVTGAPKIRAMKRIYQLESGARGVYCGAIGYISPKQQATFNVAIRTLVLQEDKGVMGSGSGIVWDSDAEAEYDECMLKGQFLTLTGAAHAFELIETMRAEGGTVPLLDLHADRMETSAGYFRYRFNRAIFEQRVSEAAQRTWSHAKVRVTLAEDGTLSVTDQPYAVPPEVQRVFIAPESVQSSDHFYFHKTTHRHFYERWYDQARAMGYDEVLFLNECGEVAEGSRTNVFIRKGSRLYTPPISSGLLGGVYRRHVLETHPEASERVLYVEDLIQADEVLLCNALMGLKTVKELVPINAALTVDP